MAIHRLAFNRILRLEPGKCAVTLSEAQLPASERMEFRSAVGAVRRGMTESLQRTTLPVLPYADKDGAVEDLAMKLRLRADEMPSDKVLLALIATCTPLQYRYPILRRAAVMDITLDEELIRPFPPRLITPGELLSVPPIQEYGMSIIPVARGIELYIFMAGVLRRCGLDAHLSYLDAHDGIGVTGTPLPSVTVISAHGATEVMITSPNLDDVARTPIVGVRIMDDASVLSYLNLIMADDSARMLNYGNRTGEISAENLESLVVTIGTALHNAHAFDAQNPFFIQMTRQLFSLLSSEQRMRVIREAGINGRVVQMLFTDGEGVMETGNAADELAEKIATDIKELVKEIAETNGIKHGIFAFAKSGMHEDEVVRRTNEIIDALTAAFETHGIECESLHGVNVMLVGFVQQQLPQLGLSREGFAAIMRHAHEKLDIGE